MQEGNDQNQSQTSQEPVEAPNFATQESGSSYIPQSQSNGSVDGINGAAHPVEEVNLSPKQITPNLAREGGYFEERQNITTPKDVTSQSSPEMQYPSYAEESESSFNPKLIIIIIVVGVILLGSVFGIIYFFKSKSSSVAEEEVVIEEDSAGDEENTAEEADTADDSSSTTPAPTPQPAPAATPVPAPTPVETPIVAPQPEEKTPDTSGAVEGSG